MARENRETEPARSRLTAGTLLNGIFVVDAPLAAGGMGEVYSGHALQTGDKVAIKVIRSDLAESETALALFRKEASALHNLSHEAIVRYFVFSVDPVIKRAYLAMEFVEGSSLEDMLEAGGAFTVEQVAVFARRVAQGLEVAHELGIIHRDISPDNIIIPSGEMRKAKIIDFGIARSTVLGGGTVIGSGFAGKYNFVSPEHLGMYDGEVKAAADIYSLGLVMAAALRGKSIDMSGSQVDVIDKRRKIPALDGVDARMVPLIERMLQPDPARRPRSMLEVADYCEQLIEKKPRTQPPLVGSTVPPQRDWSRPAAAVSTKPPAFKVVYAAAGLAAFAVIGGGALLMGPKQPAERPADRAQTGDSGGKADAGAKSTPSPIQGSPPSEPRSTLDLKAQEQPNKTDGSKLASRIDQPAISPQANAKPEVGIGSKGADDPAPRLSLPKSDSTERARRFIEGYDGGDCFKITPLLLAANSATIDGIATSATPFAVLDKAFKTAVGFEATIEFKTVTQSQCAAVSFLGRTRFDPALSPRLDVNVTELRNGQFLTGAVTGWPDLQLELLLVGEDGFVQPVASLQQPGNQRSFNIKMERPTSASYQPQLLIAVAAAKPLPGLKIAKPAHADRFFPSIAADSLDRGIAMGVAFKYIGVN
jgi:eukaryotic-like serine/threonine-protein kinase